VWDGPQVVGFKVGNTRVPGEFEIEQTNTGIRWRYAPDPDHNASMEQSSDVVKSNLAFKTISELLIKNCDGVGVSMHNMGVASL